MLLPWGDFLHIAHPYFQQGHSEGYTHFSYWSVGRQFISLGSQKAFLFSISNRLALVEWRMNGLPLTDINPCFILVIYLFCMFQSTLIVIFQHFYSTLEVVIFRHDGCGGCITRDQECCIIWEAFNKTAVHLTFKTCYPLPVLEQPCLVN